MEDEFGDVPLLSVHQKEDRPLVDLPAQVGQVVLLDDRATIVKNI